MNGEQNTWNAGNRGNVIFRWMSPNISGDVLKHSQECLQTFPGMLLNIPGNVAKHSRECHKTFQGMLPNIPWNVIKHSGNVTKSSWECCQTFWGMSPNVPGNVAKHSGECRETFQGMLPIFGSSAKKANDLSTLTISAIKLHRRFSTGFQMCLWLNVL